MYGFEIPILKLIGLINKFCGKNLFFCFPKLKLESLVLY